MPQVVIENPILNSPFAEPKRHFRFTDEGITDEIEESRRESAYFVPIPKVKQKHRLQLALSDEWTADRVEKNPFINDIRRSVSTWRNLGWPGVTPISRQLLEYWTEPGRERKLFFCQIEALETLIYITEVAPTLNDVWIQNNIRQANDRTNPLLNRMACKMATGSGKTVVMGMLIAWQALNKFADNSDPRFSDTFLIVSPGITIRDRLRVLQPNDPQNYYRQRDILPADMLETLQNASILITNFHAFRRRERGDAARLTKRILAQGSTADPFVESDGEMVRRVCRSLGNKRKIVVINDEAHHCYRSLPAGEKLDQKDEKLDQEDEKRVLEARVWISGIEAVKAKIGVKAVYDLSATPFFLRGSGYQEGTLFPWVVSDFSLIDAIESGIVKIPRVPVADNALTGDQPTYRNLWTRISKELPKRGRRSEDVNVEPRLPVELEGALESLYNHYKQSFQLWEQNTLARENGLTAPVFIVVCSTTLVSKLIFDHIAGWEKTFPDGAKRVQAGALPLFSNEQDGAWTRRPNTLLIDSEQLESGEGMSADFKQIAAREIEEFRAEYRIRYPGRDADDITNEDLLREVMNTVGKPGKLGEGIRCVVSVSMLSEGWDANTVTHILGVRAFGTQLLCEQVVGRGLRRISYAPGDDGLLEPEYAEVYGVPFSFIPCSGTTKTVKPGLHPTRVRALEERIASEITFPRLTGYRYELPTDRIAATFTADSRYSLSTADLPTETEIAGIIGSSATHSLDDLRRTRMQEVAFRLAKRTLELKLYEGVNRPWLFPQLLTITRNWLEQCVTCKDHTFPQLFLLSAYADAAAERIYQSIVSAASGDPALLPVLRPYDPVGSTRVVDFDTIKPTARTDQARCHVSHVVADSRWEFKMADTLESMPEVVRYVKNQGLGFTIPYTINGQQHSYIPDFIVHVDDGLGSNDLLNLIVEVSGQDLKEKTEKVHAARSLWVPAVNNHGGYGRWAFVEVTDPWDAEGTIRAVTSTGAQQERAAAWLG